MFEIRRRAQRALYGSLGVPVVALAIGLSAHLLSANIPSHDGSLRDVLVLCAALLLTRFVCEKLDFTTGVLLTVAAASIAVAVGWLFFEDPAHVELIQIIATIVSLLPMFCVFLGAVLLFRRAALVAVHIITELITKVLCADRCEHAVYRVRSGGVRLKFRDIRLRGTSRRGPPLPQSVRPAYT